MFLIHLKINTLIKAAGITIATCRFTVQPNLSGVFHKYYYSEDLQGIQSYTHQYTVLPQMSAPVLIISTFDMPGTRLTPVAQT